MVDINLFQKDVTPPAPSAWIFAPSNNDPQHTSNYTTEMIRTKHTLTLAVGLALLLSLFAGTGVLGQSTQSLAPHSTQTISASTSLASEAQRESTIGSLSLWLASGEANRAHRWSHPSFRIRLGRGFTITVPKS